MLPKEDWLMLHSLLHSLADKGSTAPSGSCTPTEAEQRSHRVQVPQAAPPGRIRRSSRARALGAQHNWRRRLEGYES